MLRCGGETFLAAWRRVRTHGLGGSGDRVRLCIGTSCRPMEMPSGIGGWVGLDLGRVYAAAMAIAVVVLVALLALWVSTGNAEAIAAWGAQRIRYAIIWGVAGALMAAIVGLAKALLSRA